MQMITPPLPTVPNSAVTPQTVVHALPHVAALAASPITERAVRPTPTSEKDNKARSNKERRKGGDQPPLSSADGDRGHFVNTSV